MMQLKQVFDHFSKNHMKILFGDFNVKLGMDNWDSNDNVVRTVKLLHQEICVLRAQCSRTEAFINLDLS